MFVLLAMLGAISFWGPTHPETHILEVAGVAIGYITYNLAAFFASRHEKWVRTRDLVIAPAILYPLVLSAWLFLPGPSSLLIVGLSLFTLPRLRFRAALTPN